MSIRTHLKNQIMKTRSTYMFKYIVVMISLISCNSEKPKHQHKTTPKESQTGEVIFNVDTKAYYARKTHQLTLYGCDTTVTIDTLKWGKDGQRLQGIPYGYQDDSSFISKYYLASPPVFHLSKGERKVHSIDTLIDLGLVIPDSLVLSQQTPKQSVSVNYDTLTPIYLTNIPVNFDNCDTNVFKKKPIPFNVVCDSFRTRYDGTNTEKVSGIGFLQKIPHHDSLFTPSYTKNTKESLLACRVTILDDIILNHEIFFVQGTDSMKTIDLKAFYLTNYADSTNSWNKSIKIVSKSRGTKRPCGCVDPSQIKK